MKRIGMCIWLLVASLSLGGQTLWSDGTWCVTSGTTPERMLLEERNLWLGSTNPAALGVRPMPDYGTTRLGATSESGAYRRPQQAAEALSAGFHSDSYLSLKGLHLWGAFDFTQKWHRNRAWADIRDPYNGNPYSAGSAVASRYQEQTVDFHVKASSHRIGRRWWVGAALDYSTGDFSRSSDPRTRTQSLDLAVRPGIAVELSPRSTVGVNGSYRFAKEKMLKPVCKESDNYDKYPYYAFKGMGEYDEPDLLSFSRRFMANYYGGEAQYRYGSGGFSLIVRRRPFGATASKDRIGRVRAITAKRYGAGLSKACWNARRGFMRSNCTMSRRRAGPTSSYKNRSPYKIPTVHLRATGERFLARSNTGLRATKRAPGGVITGWTAVTATGGMSVPNYGTAILKIVTCCPRLHWPRRVPAPNYRPVCRSFAARRTSSGQI